MENQAQEKSEQVVPEGVKENENAWNVPVNVKEAKNDWNVPANVKEAKDAWNVPANPVMRENAPYFLSMCLIYGICFVVAFYQNFMGITFPLIVAATLAVCGLFLKKSGIPWKRSNWLYVGAGLLLGISTVLTANGFVIFFNTVGILLLITVFMLRQVYDSGKWGFGQYLCNILFLYLSMIPEIASPFIHLGNHWRNIRSRELGEDKKKSGNGKYIFLGILLGLPMLLVAVELLSSADQIFSKVVGEVVHNFWGQIVFSPNLFLVAVLLIMGFFGSYCFLSALTLQNMPEWKRKEYKRNPVVAITFLSMMTVVYLLFCGIQVVFLFTGGRLLPQGYTYAEYARQGFFQLLFVCMCNLLLVLFCLAVFRRSRWLKILLLIFSGCTYIMIISSAYRMALYISVYHLSFLRVLVLWFLAMLAVLLAGVILDIQKEKFQLFRYCMAVVTVFYLVFSFGRVDAVVANYNVAQLGDAISYRDVVYLTGLSMDAVPDLSKCKFEHENHDNVSAYYGLGSDGSITMYDDREWMEDSSTVTYDDQEQVENSSTVTYDNQGQEEDGSTALYDDSEWNEDTEFNGYSGSVYGDYYKSSDRTRKNVYHAGCRRCRLEWKFQQVLDATEDMGIRSFHISKYRARRAVQNFRK